MDELETDPNETLCVGVSDPEKGRAVVRYTYGDDEELTAYFFDREFCEKLWEYKMDSMSHGGFRLVYAIPTDIEIKDDRLVVSLSIPMPWTEGEEVPSVPEEEQTFDFASEVSGCPVPQKCEALVVGLGYYLSEDECLELERQANSGGTLLLKAEPENEHDPDAVAAFTPERKKIGYVSKDFLPAVHALLDDSPSVEAVMTYMAFKAKSVNIEINAESAVPLKMYNLFARYTPIEVYRATYLYKEWGGTLEKDEVGLFDPKCQRIDFDKLSSLPADRQNRIAEIWAERMVKANIPNPDNLKWRMNVKLDLADYGTSWKEIDLADESKLKVIELESKMLAIYIRARRKGFRGSPEDFMKEMDFEVNESLIRRMHYEYDNNRL